MSSPNPIADITKTLTTTLNPALVQAASTTTKSADTKSALDMGEGAKKNEVLQTIVKTSEQPSQLEDNVKLFCAYLLDEMISKPSTEQSISFLSHISFLLHIIQNKAPILPEALENFMNQARQNNWFKQHGMSGCENIPIDNVRKWMKSNDKIVPEKIINFSTNLDTFAHITLLRKIIDDIVKSNFPLNVSSTAFVPHYQYLIDIFMNRVFLVLNTTEKMKFSFFKKIISLFMNFPIGAMSQPGRFIKLLNKMMIDDLDNLSLDDIFSVLKLNQHIDDIDGVKLFDLKEKAEILERILPRMTRDKARDLMNLQCGFFKAISDKSLEKLKRYLFDNDDLLQGVSLPWEKMTQDSLLRLLGDAPKDNKINGEALKLHLPCTEKSREDALLKAISGLNQSLKMPERLDIVRLGAIVLCAKLLNYIGTLPTTRDSMMHIMYITFLLDTLYRPAGKGPNVKDVLEYFLKISKKMRWFEKLEMPECNGVKPENLLIKLLLGSDVTKKMNFLRFTNLIQYGAGVALPKIINSEFGPEIVEVVEQTFNPKKNSYDIFLMAWTKEMGELTLVSAEKYEDKIPLLICCGKDLVIYGLDKDRNPKLTKLNKKHFGDLQNNFVITNVPQLLKRSQIQQKLFWHILNERGHNSTLHVTDIFKAHYGNWAESLMPNLFGVLQNQSLVQRSTDFSFVCPFSGLVLDFPVNPLEVQINSFIKGIIRYAVLIPGFFSANDIFLALKLLEYYEVKIGVKLLNQAEKNALLNIMLSSISSLNFEERRRLIPTIMRFQWTIFHELPKTRFSELDSFFEDYHEFRIETTKDFPWEKELADALREKLDVREYQYLKTNFICPDTGKELDIVYMRDKIKLVLHIDGPSHFYLDRDDENYETMVRNQALENAGWMNFCFKLKPNSFDKNKLKKIVVTEFVSKAMKFITDSHKLKSHQTVNSLGGSNFDKGDRKYQDETAKGTNSVSKTEGAGSSKMTVNANSPQKPPIIFSLLSSSIEPSAVLAASNMSLTSEESRTSFDSKFLAENGNGIKIPVNQSEISLCSSSLATADSKFKDETTKTPNLVIRFGNPDALKNKVNSNGPNMPVELSAVLCAPIAPSTTIDKSTPSVENKLLAERSVGAGTSATKQVHNQLTSTSPSNGSNLNVTSGRAICYAYDSKNNKTTAVDSSGAKRGSKVATKPNAPNPTNAGRAGKASHSKVKPKAGKKKNGAKKKPVTRNKVNKNAGGCSG